MGMLRALQKEISATGLAGGVIKHLQQLTSFVSHHYTEGTAAEIQPNSSH